MLFSGIVFSAVAHWIYDVLKLIRFPKKIRFLQFVIMSVLCIIAGLATFWLVWVLKDGNWRIYDPISQVGGMAIYGYYLQKPFLFFRKVLTVLLFRPIYLVLRTMVYIIRRILFFIYRIFRYIRWLFRLIWKKFGFTPLKKSKE